MEKRRLEIPEQKDYEYAYAQAYGIACDKLKSIRDIEFQCRKSGAECRKTADGYEITVRYLGQPYIIGFPDGGVSRADDKEEVPIREKVLIMHYFLSAKGAPLTNSKITFRELPEGKVYLRTFAKRTTNPLVRFFGKEPELLLRTAAGMGGYKEDYGDTAVTIPAFEYVPLTFLIWKGDEEFSPEANILFDSTITDYLSTEDIIVACEMIVWKLVRAM
jgi:hypothetical protein